MTEPRRLLDQAMGGDDELAALLSAARDDGPTAADRRAVAAAIGLGVAVAAIGAGATAAASGGASGAGALGAKAAAGKLGGLALLKLGGGMVLVFGLGIATGVEVQKARTRSAPSVVSAPAVVVSAPAPRAPAPTTPAPEEPRAPEPAPAPPPVTTPASARPPSPTITQPSVAPAPAASMLAQETALVERARKAVGSHAYTDAIAALDAYDVLAPSGVLVQEARALRIQAYAEQGKRLAALDLGHAFLAEYPSSPYAKRVRAIVDTLDAPKNP